MSTWLSWGIRISGNRPFSISSHAGSADRRAGLPQRYRYFNHQEQKDASELPSGKTRICLSRLPTCWTPCPSRTISFSSRPSPRRPVKGKWWLRSIAWSRELGIHQLLEKYPYEISGGQKQRVLAARAIITSPGNSPCWWANRALDSKSSAALLDVFEDINSMGQTILMVTHSTAATARAKRVLFIKDGILYNQIFRGERQSVRCSKKSRIPWRSWQVRWSRCYD